MGDKVKFEITERNGTDLDPLEGGEESLRAEIVDVDNTSNGYASDDVQACLEEGDRKRSGTIPAISFTGNPKKATVTFSTALPDANYIPKVIGEDGRIWSYESKTATGFVINSNANQALAFPVVWEAVPLKEFS
jgi:hypothetical protein